LRLNIFNKGAILPLLEVRSLSYAYDDREVLSNLSFELERGEIVGLFGPNGAGKSTLFRLLTGLTPISSGEIIFDKKRVGRAPRTVDDRIRARVGVVFQANSLDVKLTARSNLRLSGSLYGLSRKETDDQIEQGAAALRVSDVLDSPVKTLSGGTQRKVELVRALLHRPEIVFLDEPSGGFDVEGFRLFWDWILQLRKGFGLSVLIATHRADEGRQCDRLLVMNKGRVVAFETPAQLLTRVQDDQVHVKLRRSDDPTFEAQIRGACEAHFWLPQLDASATELRFLCKDGASMAPRIVEALPVGAVESIHVKRPALDDVFLAMTGSRLSNDAES
jgi:ABC-2 type transport system ATP-binding protein